MGDAGEIQLQIVGIRGQEAEDDGHVAGKDTSPTTAPPPPPISKRLRWWAVILVNIVFLLAGQSVATLLGRIYYDQGGDSLWMATVVQSCGTPLAIPLLLYFRPKSSTVVRPPLLKISAIYAGLGVLLAGDNLMYSYALLYLPMSTYSLICATQLSFNAVFSYFLNKEKFTALILNSVVLLTFSAALVGVSHSSDETNSSVPEGKFPIGFVLTLSASAVFSLILSLMQLTFDKVLKSDTFYAVLEMQFWSNTAAACVSVAGLFISGEWSTLTEEMDGYRKGKNSRRAATRDKSSRRAAPGRAEGGAGQELQESGGGPSSGVRSKWRQQASGATEASAKELHGEGRDEVERGGEEMRGNGEKKNQQEDVDVDAMWMLTWTITATSAKPLIQTGLGG